MQSATCHHMDRYEEAEYVPEKSFSISTMGGIGVWGLAHKKIFEVLPVEYCRTPFYT